MKQIILNLPKIEYKEDWLDKFHKIYPILIVVGMILGIVTGISLGILLD